ncbi:MAG: DsbA family protein [Candidatus Magasanikbacteria bacterium]|nr:DsbA family protein [Candidatus Magasanikbacteria bacterium]
MSGFVELSKDNYIPKKPWYKKTLGILFLIFSFTITALTLAFLILLGYYLWNVKFGDPTELTEKFNNHFSFSTDIPLEARPEIEEDVSQFIRSFNPTLNNTNAPITIIAFIDFECPFSQESYPILKQVVSKYDSAINVVFKHFPLTSIHPNAVQAGLASTCAQDQGMFWEYYDLLFINKKLDYESLVKNAEDLNLNISIFQNCLTKQVHRANIEQDLKDGVSLGVRGTPTYIVNQTKLEGTTNLSSWDSIIVSELQK